MLFTLELQQPGVIVKPFQGARVIALNRQHLLNALDVKTLRRIRTTLAQVPFQ